MRYRVRWEIPVVIGGLLGCVHVSAEEIAPNKYAPVAPDSVLVFTGPQELRDRGYEWETIAVLFASGSADYTSNKGMLSKLREEAAKRGANGVLLGEQKEPGFGERLFFGHAAQRKSQIMAIRWWAVSLAPVAAADWEMIELTPDLEHLDRVLWDAARAEEGYFETNHRYTDEIRALAISIPSNVTLTIPRAAATGFTARVEDDQLPGVRCVIFVGPEVSYQEFPETEAAVTTCARRRMKG